MALSEEERKKKRKEMDVNKDGTISDEERQAYKDRKALEPDVLSKQELAQKYEYALDVIYSNRELKNLFERAVSAKDGQWTREKFLAKLRNTDWWANGSYWRKAWVSKKEGTEWDNDMATASEAVSRRANSLGAKLSDRQLQQLSKQYLFEGWYDGNRSTMLDEALSEYMGGDPDRVGDVDYGSQLREWAYDYGVEKFYDDSWYTSQLQRLARGETTLDNLKSGFRSKAQSKYVPFAEALNNGETTRQAMSGYLSSMAEILELDQDQIDIDDPTLKKAWAGEVGEDGKAKPMSIYDFETTLRQDERWKQTGNGRRSMMSLADSFASMMGLNGRRG